MSKKLYKVDVEQQDFGYLEFEAEDDLPEEELEELATDLVNQGDCRWNENELKFSFRK